MIFNKSIIVSTAIAALLSVASAGKASGKVKGQIGALVDKDNFCMFLPPIYGGEIAVHEDDAVAFCTKPIAAAKGAGLLPPGFIKSAHFVRNTQSQWVQVTGRMDGSKYGLKKNDGGGQYDIKAPVGSKCAGYKYYVELVEPDINTYCFRCCQNKADCPVNKSTYGCKKVLGGNYE
ncbi:hypothetical protein BX616_010583 [Lobosporangium transversale]|uniref:Uncharacterized protein n=1 Tax=Lobosporangium transversale TaxID=64571 RepID=A0A1Y2G592_9FUNG|nr:hypothetical protein BCR41DRAFT_242887 [Lobosporangium transversale]KAF9911466.1 hypothetical protein BX616_010583 [Lobosporangium transversale]ORY94336.1 hypothetical protein BCR41DRAFT_242887 [Lobosporangium transversale]|eukprot:XP_021875278.1 hypothetical protein BCR41DRAFT_242887 [Lobosporangium transversale]